MTATEFRCGSCSAEKYKQETVPSVRKAIVVGVVLLTLAAASSCGYAAHTALTDSAQATPAAVAVPAPTPAPDSAPASASPAPMRLRTGLRNGLHADERCDCGKHGARLAWCDRAWWQGRLPSGLWLAQACRRTGARWIARTSEPMTEDTIFDMASLTKCLATATAVMQLYEQGQVQLDDPVQKYLPDFNTGERPTACKGDGSHAADAHFRRTGRRTPRRSMGTGQRRQTRSIRRALNTPLESPPGEDFNYADINFILIGALIERTHRRARRRLRSRNVFAHLAWKKLAIFPRRKHVVHMWVRGSAVAWAPAPIGGMPGVCPQARGVRVCCRASHRRHMTTRAGTIGQKSRF